VLQELARAEAAAGREAACMHLEEALSLATDPLQRAEIALEVAEAYAGLFRWVEAVDVLERALAELGAADDELAARLEGELVVCGLHDARRASRVAPVLGRLSSRSLSGSRVNHITLLPRDLDRLAASYEEVIGARRLVELQPEPDGPARHAGIGIGGGAALHGFEHAWVAVAPAQAMFERGRIDHFTLNVAEVETFARLRSDLLARGVSDGSVTDIGVVPALTFTSQDGHAVELAHWVGGPEPVNLDMSGASGAELNARCPGRDRIPTAGGRMSEVHPSSVSGRW
jgi:catechol 2,3-dioxygenase-like lactoylglutathione lyase family enzyme